MKEMQRCNAVLVIIKFKDKVFLPLLLEIY